MARPKRPLRVVAWMRVLDKERLKRHRIRKDLTQRQLAFLVGVSQTTIYLLESGGMRTLSERLALRIAKRLDQPWEDLFASERAVSVPDVTNGVDTDGRIAS